MKLAKRIIVSIMSLIFAFGCTATFAGCNKEATYTVKFFAGAQDVYYYDDNGNEVKVPEEGLVQTGIKSADQIILPVFYRKGFNFAGWDGNVWEIKSDKNFTAMWQEYNLTIIYNGNGGRYNGQKVVKYTDVTDGQDALDRAPAFVKYGYDLTWDKTEQEFKQLKSNTTINAVWKPQKAKMSFYDRYAQENKIIEQEIDYNSKVGDVNQIATGTEGLKFAYWEREDGVEIDKGAIWSILEESYLKPVFVSDDNYVITYDLDGGESQGKSYYFDDTIEELPVVNPKRTGYDFKGWRINGTDVVKRSEDITLDDIKTNGQFTDLTLKAEWTAQQYYIMFDVDGGETPNPNPLKIVYDQPISGLPSVVKEGYKFDGWYIDDQEIIDGMISEYDGNVTVTAKFLYTYKVKFGLVTKVKEKDVYGNSIMMDVECRLTSWGDLPKSETGAITDLVIEVVEGQSLTTAIKGFVSLPTVTPLKTNEDAFYSFWFVGYWKWFYDDYQKSLIIKADTIFTPSKLKGVGAGDVITIVPTCLSKYMKI